MKNDGKFVYFVEEALGNSFEARQDDVDMIRQPGDTEDDDHQWDDAAGLGRAFTGTLLINGRRTLCTQEPDTVMQPPSATNYDIKAYRHAA